MVLHLRAPKGKVSVEGMLNRAKYFDRTGKVNDHTIYLSGNLGKNVNTIVSSRAIVSGSLM